MRLGVQAAVVPDHKASQPVIPQVNKAASTGKIEAQEFYVTQQGTNVKLPDDDTEMSKHVAVYII